MTKPGFRTMLAAGALALSPALLGLHTESAHGVAATSRPWSQEGADEGRSQWLRGESKLTTANASRLSSQYALARLEDWGGECNFSEAFPVKPVATPSTLVYEDGRHLRAVSLGTGDVRWKVATTDNAGAERVRALALGDGKVVAGFINKCESVSDPDGHLAAYDAATGRKVWETGFDGPVKSMAVSGNTVLVFTSDLYGDDVTAHSLATGASLWTRRNCGPTSDIGLIAVAGKVPTYCGVLDLATGRTLWQAAGVGFHRGDSPGAQNPKLYGQLANGALVAYRPDGTRAWTSPTSRRVLAAGPSRLIVGCSEGSGVCAVDRATGARAWRRPGVTPTTAALIGAGLLVTDAGANGRAAAFNAATGQPIDLYHVHAPRDSALQASNGHLLVEVGRVLNVYAPTDE